MVGKVYKKKKKTTQKILHKSKRLFEEKGIKNVTIDEIAQVAEISRSTFFSHFKNMDDLLNTIALQEIEDLTNSVADRNDLTRREELLQIMIKLLEDTYKYPLLTIELITKAIIRNDENNSIKVIMQDMVRDIKLKDTSKDFDVLDLLLGVYFGQVYSKLIKKEKFNDLEEGIEKLKKVYDFFIE